MKTHDIFHTIRQSCEFVARHSRWVEIDYSRLDDFEKLLELDAQIPLGHTEEHHLLGYGNETISFFLLLDSINFGSGYFPQIKKTSGMSGYFSIAKKLKEWILREGIPSATRLQTLTAKDCCRIFDQLDENKHADELMALFSLALNHLGAWLHKKWDGDYVAVFRHHDFASEVIASVVDMPFYRDTAYYNGLDVPFYKRAQILIQDVRLADPFNPALDFEDIDQLTPFADNVLPYVLKSDGVLKYDNWLAERVERGELIGSGSTEEVEIRACTIHAIDQLNSSIAKRKPITMRELDFHIWNRGQKLKSQVSDFRHRTRCVYY